MEILRSADVPSDRRAREFRYSRFRAGTGATILAVAALALIAFGRLNNAWIPYYIAGVIIVTLLIFHNLVTARFRPTNWLVRMTDAGLFIKFRSYLNYRFSDQDPTVVFIPYSEIRSAKLVKERQTIPDRDEGNRRATTTKTRRFIELELSGNSEQLAGALAGESKRVFARSFEGGANVSTRYQHLPVHLTPPNHLRIEWGVVPNAQTILDALTRHTLVDHAAAVSKNFVNLDGLSREEQESRLLELAQSGDMIGAVTMARTLYAYDLATAKNFVESLVVKPAKRG
jgi:hypothetical protein